MQISVNSRLYAIRHAYVVFEWRGAPGDSYDTRVL
jgi:hypothetical protein